MSQLFFPIVYRDKTAYIWFFLNFTKARSTLKIIVIVVVNHIPIPLLDVLSMSWLPHLEVLNPCQNLVWVSKDNDTCELPNNRTFSSLSFQLEALEGYDGYNPSNNERKKPKRETSQERRQGMSSQCVVPSWKSLKHQIRQDLSQAEEGNRSSHVDLNSHIFCPQSFSQIVPMSNHEVTELTWENGQLAMHELGGMFPPPPPPPSSISSSPPKPSWGGIGQAGDTLESLVHQATYCNTRSPNPIPNSAQNIRKVGSFVASSRGKWVENSVPIQNAPPPPPPSGLAKKRSHSETDHSRLPNDRESASASANAAFCRDNNDTTMMTWASHESPRSCTRTKTTTDEDSACHGGSGNHDEEREAKGETGRSYTTRKGRAAAVHNQSERRRRDRINQKMKALQKLVPNASKTDKASMLDEVIEYLKQLQAQVQMISNARFMPQIMMPAIGMQQHLQQMSLLARMGMGMGAGLGMGIGMLDTASIGQNPTPPQTIPQLIHPSQAANSTSAFVPPGAFVLPPMIPQTQQANPVPGTSSSAPLQDPYTALLAQSMNMDLYNRIATLQRQQQQRTPPQPTSNPLHSNHHVHGG